jgi:SAM-dependent methyltransferase
LTSSDKRNAVGYWDQIWQDGTRRSGWMQPHPFIRQNETLLRRDGVGTILDLGAGIGRHSIYLAARGYTVCALDGSASGLRVIREQARRRGLRIELQKSSLDHLPYKNQSMDATVCWDTLYHGLPEEITGRIKELGRVLKTGGLLLASMLSKDNGLYGKGERIAAHTYVSEGVGDKAHPHFYCDNAELKHLLADYRILVMDHKDYGSYPRAYHWLFAARKTEHRI